MNNRRIYCIRNCTAPKECRISIKLHRSPHDFDQVYGHGVFDRYYSTTCSGEDITVTEHGTASAGKWPTLAHGKSRVAANQGRQGSRRVPKTVPRRRPGPTPQRPSVGRLQPTWLSCSWTSWSGFPLRRRGPERCQGLYCLDGRRVQVVRYLVGERAAVVGLRAVHGHTAGDANSFQVQRRYHRIRKESSFRYANFRGPGGKKAAAAGHPQEFRRSNFLLHSMRAPLLMWLGATWRPRLLEGPPIPFSKSTGAPSTQQ